MTVQGKLVSYEHQLADGLDDAGWDKRQWPDPAVRVGVRIHRLWRRMGSSTKDDQLMLHRFLPESGVHDPHSHPMAVAAHVLGPGAYEVGFVTNNLCQARMICDADFYYEMRTSEVAHYVLPRSGPIYSVAMWTAFPALFNGAPSDPLIAISADRIRDVVTETFDRLWPL